MLMIYVAFFHAWKKLVICVQYNLPPTKKIGIGKHETLGAHFLLDNLGIYR